ncbi:hypothetical protein MA16_Dca016160 [Dendrobium catenatum]|uniref:Uncharacterized protein n=1 Tax=Dendrobium catenatum TaxID=906689 RepID=A0A2I0WBR5_9ASPA|nr:hypothetical protein MA16_Dca016160 [Dendrobium catenatum]
MEVQGIAIVEQRCSDKALAVAARRRCNIDGWAYMQDQWPGGEGSPGLELWDYSSPRALMSFYPEISRHGFLQILRQFTLPLRHDKPARSRNCGRGHRFRSQHRARALPNRRPEVQLSLGEEAEIGRLRQAGGAATQLQTPDTRFPSRFRSRWSDLNSTNLISLDSEMPRVISSRRFELSSSGRCRITKSISPEVASELE